MMRDPIEDKQEFKEALEKIQHKLDEFDKWLDENHNATGRCPIYWARKKELLKGQGIDWKTPAEMNPHVLFD